MLSSSVKLGQSHWSCSTKLAYAAKGLACAFFLIHVSKRILQPLPWEEGAEGQGQRKTPKRNPEESRARG